LITIMFSKKLATTITWVKINVIVEIMRNVASLIDIKSFIQIIYILFELYQMGFNF